MHGYVTHKKKKKKEKCSDLQNITFEIRIAFSRSNALILSIYVPKA